MSSSFVSERLFASTNAGIVLTAACILLAGRSGLAQDTTVVHGLDDSSRDPARVQSAVDRGGTVALRGTFDFGDGGSVGIRRDVEILGELSNGQPLAKIKGGKWSFHSPLPKAFPPAEPGPSIAIRGIHFDGAAWAPIHIAYARRVVVSDNRITAARPVPSPAPLLGREGLLLQQGISLGPLLSFPATYPAASLTGEIRTERNQIDLATGDPTRTMGQAIIPLWATGASGNLLFGNATSSFRSGAGMAIQEDDGVHGNLVLDVGHQHQAQEEPEATTQGAGR